MGIAEALLSVGCNVYITGRNEERLDGAVAELMADNRQGVGGLVRGEAYSLKSDCTNEQSVIDDIFQKVKNVDLLINNAGTTVESKVEDLTIDQFNNVMNVNVTAPFLCSREAIKQMKARNVGGRIINIGSLSCMSSRPDATSYTTSKFALLGLTHSLALDCRSHGIVVGIVHPGNVMSGLLSKEMVEAREKTEGFISKEDVAAAVLTMANLPYHANIFELTVMPTKQPLIGRG